MSQSVERLQSESSLSAGLKKDKWRSLAAAVQDLSLTSGLTTLLLLATPLRPSSYMKVSETEVRGERMLNWDLGTVSFLLLQDPGPNRVSRIGSRRRPWSSPSRITRKIILEKVMMT